MAKEVLVISPSRVQVDYDFRNDSDQDVTTEVAFPIPQYRNEPTGPSIDSASFSDFHLAVNNKPIKFQTEARAFLNGHEVTSILNADKIDVATFGHWDDIKQFAPEFSHLPKSEQTKLVKLGLFDAEQPWGNWKVHLQYHWRQTFPAHSTVHIHHEYTPIEGFEMMPLGTIRKALHEPQASTEFWATTSTEDLQLMSSFCPDTSFLYALEKSMASAQSEDTEYAHPHWVDFVLTSANTWKQPIEDFTLIIERGSLYADENSTLVSFCSPEHVPVTKVDQNHFQIHLANFIPTSELRIGYFDLPAPATRKTK